MVGELCSASVRSHTGSPRKEGDDEGVPRRGKRAGGTPLLGDECTTLGFARQRKSHTVPQEEHYILRCRHALPLAQLTISQ